MEALLDSCTSNNDLHTAKSLLDRFKTMKKTEMKRSPFIIASNTLCASLIRLSVKLGDPKCAVDLFFYTQTQGIILPDSYVFVAALQACSSSSTSCSNGSGIRCNRNISSNSSNRDICNSSASNIISFTSSRPPSASSSSSSSSSGNGNCAQHCRLIEFLVVERGLESHIVVGNSLIHTYVKCGLFEDARQVFDRLESGRRNVVTWSSMMSGYATYGHSDEAFRLFQHMQCEGSVALNKVPFICVLKSCPSLHIGKTLHMYVVANGMDSDIVVRNALVEMYAQCGSLNLSHSVFNQSLILDVVTFGSMMGGFIKHNQFEEALKLFERILESSIKPNEVIFVYAFKTCSMLGSLDDGKLIHGLLIEDNIPFHGTIGNTLIDMYGNLGSLEDAFRVFDRSPKEDVVTWSALISACSLHNQDKEALQLFDKMRETGGIDPDHIIFTCTLKACSNISALRKGQMIHIHLIKSGIGFELSSSNTLIDLYIKCGRLEDACRVFNRSAKKSVVTWNTIILGCCECGQFYLAKKYFIEMQQRGIEPNTMTFSCLLLTCSHMGRVRDGLSFYKLMCDNHGMAPELGHFVSLVHLLGHTGHLDEAKCLLATMPYGPGVVGWRSLLSQCGAHGNVKLGQQCFESVSLGDQREAAGYVLMSTMHLHPDTRIEVEEMRKYVNAWKKPAQAFIEVDGKVHSFNVGEECHPEIHNVHEKLKQMCAKMVEEGYLHRW